jgi:hypothetical protein
MVALTKNEIGISIILMAIFCLISLPELTLAASTQPINYQSAQTPFDSTVVQPDFSVYAFSSYLRVPVGSSVNSSIMVSSLFKFNGTVSLSASFPVGWASSSPVPSLLSLTSDRHGCYNSSRLTVAVPSGAAVGTYNITVTGTSGALVHSVNVTVEVVNSDFGWFRYY